MFAGIAGLEVNLPLIKAVISVDGLYDIDFNTDIGRCIPVKLRQMACRFEVKGLFLRFFRWKLSCKIVLGRRQTEFLLVT